jgi:hypothetical protein
MIRPTSLPFLLVFMALAHLTAEASTQGTSGRTAIRVMTMNAKDISSEDLLDASNPRLKRLAGIIQRVRPNVLLLSEIALDQDALNASRFVDLYLSVPQEPSLSPIQFNTYMPPTNTGVMSGQDLDHNGSVENTFQPPDRSDENGNAPRQTAQGRAYGGDSYGFGTYPGQYSLALLVDPKLKIDTDSIRTFQNFLWMKLPHNSPPLDKSSAPWYTKSEWDIFRLSSKTFADVPVILPDGTSTHFLISHPTPPAFDGPEGRNKRRNHDEIKLIRAYIDNDPALIDDAGSILTSTS